MGTALPQPRDLDRFLGEIREGLAADGYDLVASVGGERLQVHVLATEDACDDCLVPKSVFTDIVAAALDGHVGRDRIDVVYPSEQPDADDGAAGEAGPSPRMQLSARRGHISGWKEMQRLAREQGWSDGLPVVPPTPAEVERFLDAAGLPPDATIAQAPERNVVFRAEGLAINAVMAGAEPQHMPTLVAALQAVCDPRFKFNHLASLGSPWPLFLVSGPEAARIGLSHDLYLFGPDAPVNSQLARAFSFTMRNIAFARTGGIQRGQWGNPVRWQNFVAEDPRGPWGPLNATLGYGPEDSTVTAVSVYPAAPYHISAADLVAKRMVDGACHAIAQWGGGQYTRGVYVLMIGPHHAEALDRQGWDRDRIREYILENTRTTVADLKRRGAWGQAAEGMSDEEMAITPADEQREVFLFRSNGDLDRSLWVKAALEDRDYDVLVVVTGGDAGRRLALAMPYQLSSNPATRLIAR